MAPPNPSMWNTLGLGVAASYFALGLATVWLPNRTAELFGFHEMTEGNAADVPAMLSLVGARDLSIATALFALGRTRKNQEMGTVILSTMILCVVDICVVWRKRRQMEALLFTAGAAIWGVVGLGLYGVFD